MVDNKQDVYYQLRPDEVYMPSRVIIQAEIVAAKVTRAPGERV